MNETIRITVGLLFAGLLFWQARRVHGQPHRRRTFGLAALAMLALTGYNLLFALGAATGWLPSAMLGVAGVLLVASLASLGLAWRAGELREQREKFRAVVREKARERERERDVRR